LIKSCKVVVEKPGTNLGALPDKAFFLFAPVKIQGGHSAPGRAIALY
jgi:kynurenine formamidase